MGHTGETLAASRSWEDILQLSDKLSMGISFRPEPEIAEHELYAAARSFSGEPPLALWEEAFETDPHLPRDELFAGGFRVNAYFPPDEYRQAEVDYAKSLEHQLEAIYTTIRANGVSFEAQAELEFGAMLYAMLGPLLDPERFAAELQAAMVPLLREWAQDVVDLSPGSAYGLYMTRSERKIKAQHFAERFPEVRARPHEFAGSPIVRNMPALRYPAVLRAALATMSGRRPKRGDGYDIEHLTKGLSRCDIVTADSGMTQLVKDHRLVPSGCQLFRFNDIAGLTAAIEVALGGRPTC
jgi:hypothetical protein